MTMTFTVEGVGIVLRHWRVSAGLSQRSLARKISEYVQVSYGLVQRYELDEIGDPDPVILTAWAEACGRKRGELPASVNDKMERIGRLSQMPCYLPKAQRRQPVATPTPEAA